MTTRRFGLISDTHGRVRREVHELFAGVEMILHGGDVGGDGILAELRTIAPTHAVAGNTDDMPDLPTELVVAAPFGPVAIAHGHLWPTDQERRHRALLERFAAPRPRVILNGHTHRPLLVCSGATWFVNPGSAGARRFSEPVMACLLLWDVERDSLSFHFENLDRS